MKRKTAVKAHVEDCGRRVVTLDLNEPHQLYKNEGGDILPSVTAILGKHISKPNLVPWAHRLGKDGKDLEIHGGEGRRKGSITHFLIHGHCEGFDCDLSKCDKAEAEAAMNMFETWKKWWKESATRLIKAETQLSSGRLGYGGTIDLIGRDQEGRVFIADWKTGSRLHTEYQIQLCAYRMLYHDLHPFDEDVEYCKLIRIGMDGDYEERDFHNLTTQTEVWNAILRLYSEYKKLEDRSKGQTWPRKRLQKQSS